MQPPSPFRSAFSLIELLVVMAIVSVMIAIVSPVTSSFLSGTDVTRGGQIVADQISLARQQAVNKNCNVEVCFIQAPADRSGAYNAIQLWTVTDSGTARLTGVLRLPSQTIISPKVELSPLLTADTSVSGTDTFGGLGKCAYSGFRFRSNGTLASTINLTNNFVTVQRARDTAAPPANFFAVRINPLTGRVDSIRP